MAKATGKKRYAQYVSELAVPIPPGMLDMRHIATCDADILPSSPYHIEVITWTGTGSAYVPGKKPPKLTKGNKHIPGLIYNAFGQEPEGMYPMYHTYDEAFVFFGTNPKDPLDLGGEIEFWLGAGEHAEKWVINRSTYVYVPAGLVHCPMDCVKFERPFIEFVMVPNPVHIEHHINLWPPGYKALVK